MYMRVKRKLKNKYKNKKAHWEAGHSVARALNPSSQEARAGRNCPSPASTTHSKLQAA